MMELYWCGKNEGESGDQEVKDMFVKAKRGNFEKEQTSVNLLPS
jgi:hypothetical protein